MSKLVAIASMRNSCNHSFIHDGPTHRDFPMIWLEDMVERAIAPKEQHVPMPKEVESRLLDRIEKVEITDSLSVNSSFKVGYCESRKY